MNKKKIYKYGTWVLNIALVLAFVYTLESAFILGFVGIVLLMGCYSLYLHWSSFVMFRQQVEATIWGKPLSKEYWKPGELKNTKVKFVWRKKNENKTNKRRRTRKKD